MMIYNETIVIEESVHADWLAWAKRDYIPAVMATNCFHSYRILKVMDSPNEGVTYCIQYNTDAPENVTAFYNEHLPQMHAMMQRQFENRYVMFNTLMQNVD